MKQPIEKFNIELERNYSNYLFGSMIIYLLFIYLFTYLFILFNMFNKFLIFFVQTYEHNYRKLLFLNIHHLILFLCGADRQIRCQDKFFILNRPITKFNFIQVKKR